MGNNSQSRKWSLVINNPLEAGLDHTAISEKLHLFSPDYYCMADEIATTGTYHTHVFFYAPSPSRFSTVKKRFPIAHIEKAYGSVQENRSYLRKDGRIPTRRKPRCLGLSRNGARPRRSERRNTRRCSGSSRISGTA